MNEVVSPVSASSAGTLPAPDAGTAAGIAAVASVAPLPATVDFADAAAPSTAAAPPPAASPSVESAAGASFPAARPPESLRSRTIRGTLWTTGGYGAAQAIRLGAN